MNSKYLIVVAGPTAVGKTDFAIRLARHFHTEIINADSRQVYREMIIGTAVPSSEQLAAAKHHFIGHKSIRDQYNASIFEVEAIALLDDLFRRFNTVIMAGGSGLYINAVCKGIDDIPSVSMQVRNQLQSEYARIGLPGILSMLQEADPVYYATVDRNNPQRVLKALEISSMTGRPYSSFLTGLPKTREFITIGIGLDMERKELYNRINVRANRMMSQGLLQEVQALYDFRHLNALNTVGYKELFAFLNGTSSLEEAVDRIKGHTRQYARRQITWFRKEKNLRWFSPDENEEVLQYLHDTIKD